MKILICDDHAVFREGVRGVLSHLDADFEELEDGGAVRDRVAAAEDVELVVLDLHMPGVDGWAAFEGLRSEHPTVPVVIVSSSEDPADVRRAIDGGASGYVPKSASRDVLRAAFDLVLAGGVYVPTQALAAPEAAAPAPASAGRSGRRERAAQLTPRQLEVLTLMSKGLTNKEIGQALGIAHGTVKSHIATLLEALDVTNRTEAALVMRELDLEIVDD